MNGRNGFSEGSELVSLPLTALALRENPASPAII